MRAVPSALILSLASLLASCAAPPVAPVARANIGVANDGGPLVVTLEIPKTALRGGEQFTAVVTAKNMSKLPVVINARTGAPAYIGLWRQTSLYSEEIKRYPEFATMVASTWTLAAGASRSFPLRLTVEPDWPRGEALRLAGYIDGRADLVATVNIRVSSEERTAP